MNIKRIHKEQNTNILNEDRINNSAMLSCTVA